MPGLPGIGEQPYSCKLHAVPYPVQMESYAGAEGLYGVQVLPGVAPAWVGSAAIAAMVIATAATIFMARFTWTLLLTLCLCR